MPYLAVLAALVLSQDGTLEQFVERFRSDDPEVRARASDRVRERWKEWTAEDLEKLRKAGEDPDAEVAVRSREALARIELRRNLGEKIVENVKEAEEAFLGTNGTAKLRVLRQVRLLRAAEILKDEDLRGIEPLLKDLWKGSEEELERFLAEGREADSFTTQLLKSPRGELRARAVERIGEQGRARVADLVPFLGDGSAQVRAATLDVLSRWNSREHAGRVAALLEDPTDGVRRKAVETITRWGAESHVEVFGRLLGDKDAYVRARALGVVAGSGRKEFAAKILPLLRDARAETRAEAVGTLVEFGAREFAEEIVGLLEDPRAIVRGTAAVALGRFGHRDSAGRIGRLLEDSSPWVRSNAMGALAMLGDRARVGDLLHLLGSQDREVGGAAVQALVRLATRDQAERVAGLLERRDPFLRHDAVWLLERLGAREQAAVVARMLKDGEPLVRARAARALGKLGGPEQAGALGEGLRDADRRTRVAAALALGELGPLPAEVLRALGEASRDGDRVLGLAAAVAFIRMGRMDRAVQRERLAELARHEVAAAFLAGEAVEALNASHEKDSWDVLEKAVVLERPIDGWADLRARFKESGLRLEEPAPVQVAFASPGRSVTLRALLEVPSDGEIVLEGGSVRVLPRLDAFAYWQKRLDGK